MSLANLAAQRADRNGGQVRVGDTQRLQPHDVVGRLAVFKVSSSAAGRMDVPGFAALLNLEQNVAKGAVDNGCVWLSCSTGYRNFGQVSVGDTQAQETHHFVSDVTVTQVVALAVHRVDVPGLAVLLDLQNNGALEAVD